MDHKELEKKIRELELFEEFENKGDIYQRVPGGLMKESYSLEQTDLNISSSMTSQFIPINEPFFEDEIEEYEGNLKSDREFRIFKDTVESKYR